MDNRVERVFIRSSDDVPGVDPVKDIDSEEFCWIDPTNIDANTLGVKPLSEFWTAGFREFSEPERWYPASEGLETVTALLGHYRRIVAEGSDPLGRSTEVIAKEVGILEAVENVLTKAQSYDVHFCFVATE